MAPYFRLHRIQIIISNSCTRKFIVDPKPDHGQAECANESCSVRMTASSLRSRNNARNVTDSPRCFALGFYWLWQGQAKHSISSLEDRGTVFERRPPLMCNKASASSNASRQHPSHPGFRQQDGRWRQRGWRQARRVRSRFLRLRPTLYFTFKEKRTP